MGRRLGLPGALLVLAVLGCQASAPVAPTPTAAPSPVPAPSPTPVPVPSPTPVPVLEPRTPDGLYFLGDANAPITLEMFGDFQCPVCGQFARTEEPTLVQRYVDSGKMKLVWHDFPWIGDESFLAAQAARCAGQQGHFWAFHDYLFAHQRGENLGTFSQPALATFADALGLDAQAFGACMNRGDEPQVVQRARASGLELGLDVTPAFLINGDLRIGAPPLNRFTALIDVYLARTPR